MGFRVFALICRSLPRFSETTLSSCLHASEVGGVAQTAALTASLDAFWLRWEKEARSDVSRKVEAEARKLARGEDVASESSA